MNIFNKYYKEYDLWYDKNEDVFMTEINTINKFDLKGRGVEVGTGTGRFAEALNIKYGIEPSLNMLKLARQRGIKTVYSYGESNPYEDNYFDFAVIIATLCFVDNPETVLKETYRILKKQGLVITAILKRESKWVSYYKKKDSPFYSEANFYNPEEVIELFKKTGFRFTESFQALFKGPENFKGIELPEPGFDRGSFVALGAVK